MTNERVTGMDGWGWVFLLTGLGTLANALWMLAGPMHWYTDLPAAVPDTGPFNPHFVRDIGCAFLTVGAALVWAALDAALRRPLVAVAALFLGAHALLHIYDTAVGNLPHSHWWLDLRGVYLPALLLGVAAWLHRAPEDEERKMRLQPIERPPSLMMRIGYWMARRQLGKVPSAFKVFYARAPRLGLLARRVVGELDRVSLDRELVQLLMSHASLLNGCGFCADLHLAQLVREKLGTGKFEALADYRTSPAFSDRERAALAFAEETTRSRQVSDATFQELQKHFDEGEIVEIVWVNAVGNYFNMIAVPLGLESDGLAELALSGS